MGTYCFGIDVGGTTVKCGLFMTDGTLVEQWEIPTRTENEGQSILTDIAHTIQEKVDEMGIEQDNIEGVGIGIPGPVNEKGEVPVAVNLHWKFKAVASELSALTGLKARAGNDANVAALGEAWKGAASGSRSVLMITLGTGVGGGLIIDGKIVSGFHGAGGEVGHANVNHQETIACNCGNCGCLEQYCSATGIARLAREEMASYKGESLLTQAYKNQELGAKEVFDAYKEGDEAAVNIIERFGDILGGALAIFASVIDPEAIVIGGGVSRAGKPLIEVLQKYYQKYAFSACRETPIELASLGNNAGIYGAARMVLVH
ncbi:MAG: ROK family glucokinase [Blautia sp.]|nr:ROK family glucokinase [Blautia sp.]